jgi:hypothetical protein
LVLVSSGLPQSVSAAARKRPRRQGGAPVGGAVYLLLSGVNAPGIQIISPAPDSVVNTAYPAISIEFIAEVYEIDPMSFFIELDGIELGDRFAVSETGASYQITTALAPGSHTLTAEISDTDGNSCTLSSSFLVSMAPAAVPFSAPATAPAPAAMTAPAALDLNTEPPETAAEAAWLAKREAALVAIRADYEAALAQAQVVPGVGPG